jgi:hypothetical protein
VVSLNSLGISRRYIRAGTRGLSRCRRRGSNEAILLAGKLRVRCVAVDCAVSLLTRAAARRVMRLVSDVVGRHIAISLLFIVDVLVGGIWRVYDDVPGVEEAGEESEHWKLD